MPAGKLITFEGTDGAGKTTQINLLAEDLRNRGRDVLITREPGGTVLSEKIRQLLLDPASQDMTAETEALLYAAARAQLVSKVIAPALGSGRVVLCDRFVDSSLAYQGYGRGMDQGRLQAINSFALQRVGAFLTIILDLEPDLGLRRVTGSGQLDRLEQESLSFHRRVREGYLALARLYPCRIKTVDGNASPEVVQARILLLVEDYLNRAEGDTS